MFKMLFNNLIFLWVKRKMQGVGHDGQAVRVLLGVDGAPVLGEVADGLVQRVARGAVQTETRFEPIYKNWAKRTKGKIVFVE